MNPSKVFSLTTSVSWVFPSRFSTPSQVILIFVMAGCRAFFSWVMTFPRRSSFSAAKSAVPPPALAMPLTYKECNLKLNSLKRQPNPKVNYQMSWCTCSKAHCKQSTFVAVPLDQLDHTISIANFTISQHKDLLQVTRLRGLTEDFLL